MSLLLAACNPAPQQREKAAHLVSGRFTILHTNNMPGRHQPFAVVSGNATAQTGDVGRPPSSFEHAGTVGGFAHLATAIGRVRAQRGAELDPATAAELRQLRAANRRQAQELGILKKAIAISSQTPDQ